MTPSRPQLMSNLSANLNTLTRAELEMYHSEIQCRSAKQLVWLFLYSVMLLILAIAATRLTPLWFANTLAGLLLASAFLALPVFFNVPRFLPFKLTSTRPFTLYRWRTRQGPEWMYRSFKSAGTYCLLYGDALIQKHPETKQDLKS